MTLSALFGVVLAAVGRDGASAGSTADDARGSDGPVGPGTTPRGGSRSGGSSARRGPAIPVLGAMFAMVAPPRTPAR
jgi:hypothetical protein